MNHGSKNLITEVVSFQHHADATNPIGYGYDDLPPTASLNV